MRFTAAALLRPITFVLAIVAAVLAGDSSGSFWYGLLAWLVAMGAGRVLGAIVRGRPRKALRRAIWPAAATGCAFLFAALGLPPVATFFVAAIAASLARSALRSTLRRGRTTVTVDGRSWRRVVDLDELLP